MSASDNRWFVETPDQGTHDVGADRMEFHPSGSLVFLDEDGALLLAYAPHAWVTVTYEAA